MSFEPYEIADLLMMLVLGPVTLAVARRIAPSTLVPVSVCLGLVFTGYVATILEGVTAPLFLNLVEHWAYAAAGIAFVWLLAKVAAAIGVRGAGRR